MSYRLELKNADQLIALLKANGDIAERWLQKAVAAGAAEVQKAAVRGNIPWKTGRLAQSFGEGITIGRLFAKVAPTVKYAIFVHEGTRAHTILPKNKQALFWPGAAHPVRSVNHPGTQANRFMPRLLEIATPKINQHFEAALEHIVQEIANQ